MRLSNAPDLKLQQLADGHRLIASRIDPLIFEELIDRRAAMTADRSLEALLAYERASELIQVECVPRGEDRVFAVGQSSELDGNCELEVWFDLDSFDTNGFYCDVEQAVSYLESRGLLIRHPNHDRWVAVRAEGRKS
jgi:hypothetical protein